MVSFKKIVKELLPYCIVKRHYKKFNYNFLAGVSFGKGTFGVIPENNCLFTNVLALQGFGFSGHTAGIDLLREYRSVMMPSDPQIIDKDNRYVASPSIEVDFMRLAGGLMEMEKFLGEENIFQNDAAAQRLIKMLGTCKFLQLNDTCKELTYSFVDQLIDFQIDGIRSPLYNYHLQDGMFFNKTIYFLKQLSVSEYRGLVRNFLIAVLNTFYKDGKKVIIADHLFSDLSIDLETRRQIVPNLKTIVIYRDPRDVFASGVIFDVDWIPYNDQHVFVKWWKKMLSTFDPSNSDILFVKFEDLVMNYELTKKRIEEYVGLDPQDHVFQYNCLDPQKSIANIGIWKKLTNKEEELLYIKNELSDFCFEQ